MVSSSVEPMGVERTIVDVRVFFSHRQGWSAVPAACSDTWALAMVVAPITEM